MNSRTQSNLSNTPQDPLYRRVQFLWALLWVMLITFLILGAFNYALNDIRWIAHMHWTTSILSVVLIYWHWQRPDQTFYVSWAVFIVCALVLAAYVVVMEGRDYSLIWLTIYPPVVFFLLGRRWGYILSVLVAGGGLIYAGNSAPSWHPAEFTGNSLLNIVIALAALITMLRHIERTRSEAFHYLHEHSQRLEYIAVTDPLTGLVNRTKLDQALYRGLQSARQEQKALSVIILDIDHFKKVNDTYGHQVGDRILIQLAQVLRSNTRGSDTLGRWGGEEFLLIAESCSRPQAKVLAEKIRHAVAAFSFYDDIRITVSLGVASFQPDDDESSLMRRADKALYAAKGNGRNCTITEAELAELAPN